MARARRRNKPEDVKQAGREAKLDRQIDRVVAKSPLPPFAKGGEQGAFATGGEDFEYTLSAQARALRGIERRIYGT